MNETEFLLFISALGNFLLGLIIAGYNIFLYFKRKNLHDKWTWIRILAIIAGLDFAFIYFVGMFNLMNYQPMLIDRPASLLALTVILCGTIWSARRE